MIVYEAFWQDGGKRVNRYFRKKSEAQDFLAYEVENKHLHEPYGVTEVKIPTEYKTEFVKWLNYYHR